MPASTILLLDDRPRRRRDRSPAILSGAGYTVTRTADAGRGLRARPPSTSSWSSTSSDGPRSAIEICREIRSTPTLAAVPVLCVERKRRRRGADPLPRGRRRRRHRPAVRCPRARGPRRGAAAPVPALAGTWPRSSRRTATLTVGRPRRVVVVYSPKGGVGTTTIATNVAVAAAATRPDRVVLVDLSLQFGGVATHLNLDRRQTLADLVRDDDGDARAGAARGRTPIRHESGLHVLAAPAAPEAAELITAAHVETAPRDAPSRRTTWSSSTPDRRSTSGPDRLRARRDRSILPVYAGDRRAQGDARPARLPERDRLGRPQVDVRPQQPCSRGRSSSYATSRARSATKIAIELPYDPFLYLKAVNEGVPIVIGAAALAARRALPAARPRAPSATTGTWRRWNRSPNAARAGCSGAAARDGLRPGPPVVVPEPRFELGRPRGPRSLSPLRLPFRHSGTADSLPLRPPRRAPPRTGCS